MMAGLIKNFTKAQVCVLALLVVFIFMTSQVQAGCGGSCSACARRYGCMTAAWGRCCTQFFMHNGKRSSGQPLALEDDVFSDFLDFMTKRKRTDNSDDSSDLNNDITLQRARSNFFVPKQVYFPESAPVQSVYNDWNNDDYVVRKPNH